MLNIGRILAASELLRTVIRRTPIEPSAGLSEIVGVPVWLKLESLQITGSFKIRGALVRMAELSAEERGAGS